MPPAACSVRESHHRKPLLRHSVLRSSAAGDSDANPVRAHRFQQTQACQCVWVLQRLLRQLAQLGRFSTSRKPCSTHDLSFSALLVSNSRALSCSDGHCIITEGTEAVTPESRFAQSFRGHLCGAQRFWRAQPSWVLRFARISRLLPTSCFSPHVCCRSTPPLATLSIRRVVLAYSMV